MIETGSERHEQRENPPDSVYHPLCFLKGLTSNVPTRHIGFFSDISKNSQVACGFFVAPTVSQPPRLRGASTDAENSFLKEMEKADGGGTGGNGLFGEFYFPRFGFDPIQK